MTDSCTPGSREAPIIRDDDPSVLPGEATSGTLLLQIPQKLWELRALFQRQPEHSVDRHLGGGEGKGVGGGSSEPDGRPPSRDSVSTGRMRSLCVWFFVRNGNSLGGEGQSRCG